MRGGLGIVEVHGQDVMQNGLGLVGGDVYYDKYNCYGVGWELAKFTGRMLCKTGWARSKKHISKHMSKMFQNDVKHISK